MVRRKINDESVKVPLHTTEGITTFDLYKGLMFAALIIRDYNRHTDLDDLKIHAEELAYHLAR